MTAYEAKQIVRIAYAVRSKKYTGEWIVWSKDGVTIIGSGATPEAALDKAQQTEPMVGGYECVPPADQ